MAVTREVSPDYLWIYIPLQPERELRIEFPKSEQAKTYFNQISTRKEGATLTEQYVDLKLPSTVQKLESNGLDGIVLGFESHKSASNWKDAVFWSITGRPDAVFVKLCWPPGSLDEELATDASDHQDRGDGQHEPLIGSTAFDRLREPGLIGLRPMRDLQSGLIPPLPPALSYPPLVPPPSAASSATGRRIVTLGPGYVREPSCYLAPGEQITGRYHATEGEHFNADQELFDRLRERLGDPLPLSSRKRGTERTRYAQFSDEEPSPPRPARPSALVSPAQAQKTQLGIKR